MDQPTLRAIAEGLIATSQETSKPLSYYEIYEPYLVPLRSKPVSMLEIGVYSGESIKVFSKYFAAGTVMGIDIESRDIDFSGFPNVTYRQCDQTDRNRLTQLTQEFAPDGFDLIVDDASHIGWYSLQTFETLFPKLKDGGYYVVEDWGTGYFDAWPDSSPREFYRGVRAGASFPKRIPSHDFGMVGFLKYLVDLVGSNVGSIHIHQWLAFVKKEMAE